MRFSTANTERMRILSDGNVGIGTTSPANKLNVVEGTSNWEVAEFQSSSTTGAGITLIPANINSLQWSIIGQGTSGGAGDNNLGFHLTGVGSSGGSAGYKMTIEASSGNVGIGTTSPSSILDVEAGSPEIQLTATTTTATTLGAKNNRILLTSDSSTVGAGGEVVFNTEDSTTGRWAAISGHIVQNSAAGAIGDIVFATKSANATTTLSERMRIDSDGKVGIGTASPAVELDVAGTVRSTSSSTKYAQLESNSSGGVVKGVGGNGFLVRSYGDSYFNGGDFGIGTTAPGHKLDVNHGASAGGGITTVARFSAGTGSSLGDGTQINLMNWNNSYGGFIRTVNTGGTPSYLNPKLEFGLNYQNHSAADMATKMTILGTGYVGIGTTSPDSILHIYQNTSDTSSPAGLTIEQDGAGDAVVQYLLTGNRRWVAGVDNSDSDRFKFASSANVGTDTVVTINTAEAGGNVGIGNTAPAAKLHVSGNVQVGSSANANSFGALQVNQTSNVDEEGIGVLSANGGRSMRIWVDETRSYVSSGNAGAGILVLNEGSGSVGIGTTTPNGKLDVTGDIWLNGANENAARYLRINRGHSQDGGILLYGNSTLDWQIVNLASTRDLNFYSYAAASSVVRIKSSNGQVGIASTAPTSTLTIGNTSDNQTLSLGQRASGNQSGRTVLIEGVASGTSGEGSGRIFFSEHNSTTAAADKYGISLTYSGDNTPQFPSGATPGLGNAKWALMRHDNSLNGASVIYGSRTDSNVYFANNIYMPNKLIHVNDTNTYIQFHANDQFRVVTNGSERFEVNNTQITANIGEFIATGDVGVGITSPNTRLHVYSDAGHPQVRIQEAGNAEAVGIRFQAKTSGDANVYADIKFDPDSSELIINNPYNSGTQSLTVDSSSNVFIGNDLYVPDQIIHTGDTNTYMQFNAADSWRVVVAGTETIEANTSRTKISSGNNEILRLSTTSATGSPHITFYQSTTRRSYIQHHDTGDNLNIASEYGGIRFLTGTGGTETEKMVIQADGDVGIGVTNPVNKLQVGGKIYSSGDIQANSELRGATLRLPDGGTSSASEFSEMQGFIDINVNGTVYVIPYYQKE